jgi:hypothetical protein
MKPKQKSGKKNENKQENIDEHRVLVSLRNWFSVRFALSTYFRSVALS